MRPAFLAVFAGLAGLSATTFASDGRRPAGLPGDPLPKNDGVPAVPPKAAPAAVADNPLARWVGAFDAEVEAGGKSYKMAFTGDWQAGRKFVRLTCVREDKRESFAVYGWDGTTLRSWHYDDEGGVATISGTWDGAKKELTQRHDGGPEVVTSGVWLDADTFVWTMTKGAGEEKVTVQQGKLLRRKK